MKSKPKRLMFPEGAVIRSYRDLMEVLIARCKALCLTQIELDDRAGLADGHVGIIECSRFEGRGRNLGSVSLPLLLEALRVSLLVVTEEGQILRHRTDDRIAIASKALAMQLAGKSSIWAD